MEGKTSEEERRRIVMIYCKEISAIYSKREQKGSKGGNIPMNRLTTKSGKDPYVKRTEKEDDAYPPLTEMNICSHLLLMYVTS